MVSLILIIFSVPFLTNCVNTEEPRAEPPAIVAPNATSLLEAATKGDAAAVRKLLKVVVNSDTVNDEGQTPLLLAALHGRTDTVRMVTDLSIWPDVRETAKERAKDYTAVVELLLEAGADVNLLDDHNWGPLFAAVVLGNEEMAALFLAKGARLDIEERHDRTTPAIAASSRGHLGILKLLVKQGASIEPLQIGWPAPLHGAATGGQLEVAKYLLEMGANIEVETQGYTPLHSAARRGQADMVKFLLAKEAKLEARTEAGFTPLYDAAQFGHRNSIEVLLAAGADIDAKDEYGHTPLYAAVVGWPLPEELRKQLRYRWFPKSGGQVKLAEFLVSRGADIRGLTLAQASASGSTELTTLRLAAKDDVNETRNQKDDD